MITPILIAITMTAHAVLCVNVPVIQVPLFDFQDPRLELRQNDLVKLGEGITANVFLVKDTETHQPYSLKVYKPGYESVILNDLKAFELLRTGLKIFSFDIVSFEIVNKTSAKVGYTPGQDIKRIFLNPNLNPEIRELIRKRYHQMVTEVYHYFNRNHFDEIDVNLKDPLPKLYAENNGVVYIIKPSNVLVNPYTLRLTLIDSH